MVELNKGYSYGEIIAIIRELQKRYPEILQSRYIGRSADGRLINAVRMGSGSWTLFVISGVHARETVNPPVLLRMIEEYCKSFKDDKEKFGDIRALLRSFQIIWVPLVNPDGYEIALRGFDTIRNPVLCGEAKKAGIPFTEWKYNARGTDINRNFPCSSYRSAKKGDSPASEQETNVLMNLFREYNSIGLIDFHSRGKQLFYYRKGMSRTYNSDCREEALYLQKFCGYTVEAPEKEMANPFSGGNTVQYYAEKYRKTAITVETVDENEGFPLKFSLQEETFKEIIRLPLALLEIFG